MKRPKVESAILLYLKQLHILGNICLYVVLLKTQVRKTFHNLLLLLSTFEIVSPNIFFSKYHINNYFYKPDLSCLGPQFILSAHVPPKLHAPEAEHALHSRLGPCRNGEARYHYNETFKVMQKTNVGWFPLHDFSPHS